MKRYYHYTSESNVESILEGGLRPGIEIGHQTSYRGKTCDNSFVYLARNFNVFSGDLFSGVIEQPGMSFLAVDIPSAHPIERDLDAYMMITAQGILSGFEFFRIMGALGITGVPDIVDILSEPNKEAYEILMHDINQGHAFTKSALITLIATDDKAVKTLLGRATPERWDHVIGFYRTLAPIPPDGASRIMRYNPFTELT